MIQQPLSLNSAESIQEMKIERLEQRIQELDTSLDDTTRAYEIGGDQVVERSGSIRTVGAGTHV
ncbi:hypothetical protein FDG2_5668 [Candidatus Protofrankia californiensis]|uniref:Uncharacterized protein n=1 Tax=Candidatus Protofrankia californiensis TaxID=1839754 RepID=A0A1C3PF42_9ACTN|nr:hypothetical protein FDG2_5668 [Candidatus Protofrankia californiensis]